MSHQAAAAFDSDSSSVRTTATATAIDPSSPPGKTNFMSLSAELRNIIYRYALTSDTPLVTDRGYGRPNLLRTNKEIRQEALKIYYYENEFVISSPRWCPKAEVRFYEAMRALDLKYDTRGPKAKHEVSVTDAVTSWVDFIGTNDCDPHWSNLMKWFHHAHAGDLAMDDDTPADRWRDGFRNPQEMVIDGMAAIVLEMMSRPWNVVKRVLEHQQPVLGSIDERWMED